MGICARDIQFKMVLCKDRALPQLAVMFGYLSVDATVFYALCRLIRRLVAPVADLDEKAFITHAGKITPRNANFG